MFKHTLTTFTIVLAAFSYCDGSFIKNFWERGKFKVDQSPKAVTLFCECLLRQVQNCDDLSCLFNVGDNVTYQEHNAAIFYTFSTVFGDASEKYAAEYGNKASRYIEPSDKKVTADLLFAVYSNAMAKFLLKQDVLDCKNASKLAELYADSLKSIGKAVVNNSDARSKSIALTLGFLGFISTVQQQDERRKISSTFGKEWKYQIKNKKKFEIPCTQCTSNRTNPDLTPSDDFCEIKSPATETFLKTFQSCVKSSDTLTDLFNICLAEKADEIGKGLYYASVYLLYSLGSSNSAILGDYVSKYLTDIKDLKPSQIIDMHANFMAKYLITEELLECKNAEELAKMYAKSMEKSAKSMVDKKYPKSKTAVLLFGSRAFFQQLQAYTSVKDLKLAFFYGSEWRCTAMCCGSRV